MGESDLIESIQYEVLKIITGAMKGTHKESLLIETGLLKLSKRREMHKLVMFFKMINGFSPDYLSALCPPLVSQRTTYRLRDRNNLCFPAIRTEKLNNSFLYSTIKLWNTLSELSRKCVSVRGLLFNRFNTCPTSKYFYSGDCYASILHTRLRLNNCGLNYYLFLMNCAVSPACDRGAPKEDVFHYLLICPRFATLRDIMIASIVRFTGHVWNRINSFDQLNILLNGLSTLNYYANTNIFLAVQAFIIASGRFD